MTLQWEAMHDAGAFIDRHADREEERLVYVCRYCQHEESRAGAIWTHLSTCKAKDAVDLVRRELAPASPPKAQIVMGLRAVADNVNAMALSMGRLTEAVSPFLQALSGLEGDEP